MKELVLAILICSTCRVYSQIDTVHRFSIDIRPFRIIQGEIPAGFTINKKKGKRSQVYGAGVAFFDIYSNGQGLKRNKANGALAYSGIRFNRKGSYLELRNETKYFVRDNITRYYGRSSYGFNFPGVNDLCEDCATKQTDKVVTSKVLFNWGYKGRQGKKIYFETFTSIGVKYVTSFYNITELYDMTTDHYFRFSDYKVSFTKFYPVINVGFATGVRL